MTKSTKPLFCALFLALTATAVAGCSAAGSPPDDVGHGDEVGTALSADTVALARHSYVGSIVDDKITDVRVGLVVEGDRVALFFCGGKSTVQTHTRWFRGAMPAATDGGPATPVELHNASGTAVAQIAWRSPFGAVGTVDVGDGTPLKWSVRHVRATGYAGLFEAPVPGELGLATVIVTKLDNNGRYDFQGAFRPSTPGLELEQITPLRWVTDVSPAWLVDFPVGELRQEVVVRPIQL